MMQQLAALDISMCKPVEFGKCDQGVYIIESQVEGRNSGEVIPNLTNSEKYVFGLEAGRMLKAIHSISAPENQSDWETRFNEKMDSKIKMYKDCPIKFGGAEDIIDIQNPTVNCL